MLLGEVKFFNIHILPCICAKMCGMLAASHVQQSFGYVEVCINNRSCFEGEVMAARDLGVETDSLLCMVQVVDVISGGENEMHASLVELPKTGIPEQVKRRVHAGIAVTFTKESPSLFVGLLKES
ncbi:hypothetical protein FPOAC2_10764 [Fusarium poae]|jgi:hypothetical protein